MFQDRPYQTVWFESLNPTQDHQSPDFLNRKKLKVSNSTLGVEDGLSGLSSTESTNRRRGFTVLRECLPKETQRLNIWDRSLLWIASDCYFLWLSYRHNFVFLFWIFGTLFRSFQNPLISFSYDLPLSLVKKNKKEIKKRESVRRVITLFNKMSPWGPGVPKILNEKSEEPSQKNSKYIFPDDYMLRLLDMYNDRFHNFRFRRSGTNSGSQHFLPRNRTE